jgi:hypothetical protein
MKTIKIERLKDQANAVFRESKHDYAMQRRALQCFVENLLMQHNAYKGFRYLSESDVPPSNSFGIIFDESEKREHAYPDPSRISFY